MPKGYLGRFTSANRRLARPALEEITPTWSTSINQSRRLYSQLTRNRVLFLWPDTGLTIHISAQHRRSRWDARKPIIWNCAMLFRTQLTSVCRGLTTVNAPRFYDEERLLTLLSAS